VGPRRIAPADLAQRLWLTRALKNQTLASDIVSDIVVAKAATAGSSRQTVAKSELW
jgi:hypothetical protein